ncbi:hypothetical protein [Blackfly microvirus SF02]|uniref:Uncharacterized protein n=1 Tax=Blackfly microvirus SF02 TaxID=2576452 RepID=A0A4P8PPX3_9VIRU|nr:hypothetical protein [Blackfly microvirus SF02]
MSLLRLLSLLKPKARAPRSWRGRYSEAARSFPGRLRVCTTGASVLETFSWLARVARESPFLPHAEPLRLSTICSS